MHVEDRPAKRPRISAFLLASIVVLLAGVVAIGWFAAGDSRSSSLGRVHRVGGAGVRSMDPDFSSAVPRQVLADRSGLLQRPTVPGVRRRLPWIPVTHRAGWSALARRRVGNA